MQTGNHDGAKNKLAERKRVLRATQQVTSVMGRERAPSGGNHSANEAAGPAPVVIVSKANSRQRPTCARFRLVTAVQAAVAAVARHASV